MRKTTNHFRSAKPATACDGNRRPVAPVGWRWQIERKRTKHMNSDQQISRAAHADHLRQFFDPTLQREKQLAAAK